MRLIWLSYFEPRKDIAFLTSKSSNLYSMKILKAIGIFVFIVVLMALGKGLGKPLGKIFAESNFIGPALVVIVIGILIFYFIKYFRAYKLNPTKDSTTEPSSTKENFDIKDYLFFVVMIVVMGLLIFVLKK